MRSPTTRRPRRMWQNMLMLMAVLSLASLSLGNKQPVHARATIAQASAETMVDDTDTLLAYGGTWSARTGLEGRYNGTAHETNQAKATFEFALNGTAFTLLAEQQPWGGTAELYIDDVLQQTVNFKGSTGLQQEVYTKTGLAEGTHTIRMVAKGDGWVYVDALRITGTLETPPPPQPLDLPDLVVTDIRLAPTDPFTGDTVRFTMTVTNQGTASTPNGVVIGGIFSLNGQVFGYTDTYNWSLPAGGSVELTANGGGAAGDGTWVAQEGTYTVGALVDDVNRIAESNEGNNDFQRSEPLVVITKNGPDLVVSDLTWIPESLKANRKITFRATITNRGNEPTPAGTVLGVQFLVDDQVIAVNTRSTAALQPGQSVTLAGDTEPDGSGKARWRAADGEYNVQAVADPDNLIEELRESNNARTIRFVVEQPRTDTAQPADAFVDSIGVNVHLGYLDTAYGDYEGIVKPRLQESGIRHIRDGTSLANTEVIRKLNDLATIGIRSNLITNPREPVADAVAIMKAATPSVETVEGPNEPNLFYPELFPDGIRQYQQQLYDAIKADPATSSLPVLAPAPAFGNEESVNQALGLVACDFANTHSYTGGQLPDVKLDDNIAGALVNCPGKPVMSTETGYNNALNATGGQPGISERAGGKYIPRMYLEHFIRGVQRTFAYEFLDEKPNPELTDPEQHFGMVRNDGTPKPAFTAVKNLIDLLEDPGANVTPGSLRYTLSGNVTDLGHTLLQKGDGTYYLVLWTNGRSFDSSAKTDVDVPTQSVTLTFDRPFRHATTYQPSSTAAATGSYRGRTLTLAVPDEPLVVELSPRAAKRVSIPLVTTVHAPEQR